MLAAPELLVGNQLLTEYIRHPGRIIRWECVCYSTRRSGFPVSSPSSERPCVGPGRVIAIWMPDTAVFATPPDRSIISNRSRKDEFCARHVVIRFDPDRCV
jgi:hypothetical protein